MRLLLLLRFDWFVFDRKSKVERSETTCSCRFLGSWDPGFLGSWVPGILWLSRQPRQVSVLFFFDWFPT